MSATVPVSEGYLGIVRRMGELLRSTPKASATGTEKAAPLMTTSAAHRARDTPTHTATRRGGRVRLTPTRPARRKPH